MKAYGGVKVYSYIFLTSALAGSEWSASRPGRFTPGKTTPGTYWISGWVGPRSNLDTLEKRKFLTLPGLELNCSVVQSVASRYTDVSIPAGWPCKLLFLWLFLFILTLVYTQKFIELVELLCYLRFSRKWVSRLGSLTVMSCRLFYHENGGRRFLSNVGTHLLGYKVLHDRRLQIEYKSYIYKHGVYIYKNVF
jgi:hypothetical protein